MCLKFPHKLKALFLFFLLFCLNYSLFSFENYWDKEKAYIFLSKSIIEDKYECLCSKNDEFTPPHFQIPPETFSSMVILDLLVDIEFDERIKSILIQKVINTQRSDGLYTFFKESDLLPPDVDCIALAYTTLIKAQAIKSELLEYPLNTILSNVNAEGLIEVFVDPKRFDRVDIVVCANTIYFAYLCEKNENVKITEDFIYHSLEAQNYKKGSRYYPSKFTFLYMISRLLDFPVLHKKFSCLLHQNLKEEMDTANNPLELAMCIICAKKLGNECSEKKRELASLQLEDGGWSACTFYKNGRSSEFFGSRYITTAFAIRALND